MPQKRLPRTSVKGLEEKIAYADQALTKRIKLIGAELDNRTKNRDQIERELLGACLQWGVTVFVSILGEWAKIGIAPQDFELLVEEQSERIAKLTEAKAVMPGIWEDLRLILLKPTYVGPHRKANAFRYETATLSPKKVARKAAPTVDSSEIEVERTDRQKLGDAYIRKVFQTTGKRITRTLIWKAAGDKTRSEFERWESYWYEKRGRKRNEAAHARFMDILTKNSRLK